MSLIHQIDNFSSRIINWSPSAILPSRIDQLLNTFLIKFLLFSRLASWQNNFTDSDINLRTSCFINEARKEGWQLEMLRGLFGFTNYGRAEKDGKKILFEGLPLTNQAARFKTGFIDDKGKIKTILQKNNFPVASGKSFRFWQRRKAANWDQEIGYPLVVKPSRGSNSKGITTNITSRPQLKKAINKALSYAPIFVVEKYITKAFVHRATVVDYKSIACVKQVSANIVGDGISTIRKLIEQKNNDKRRNEWGQKSSTLYKIAPDRNSIELLSARGLNLLSIPRARETIYLQKDPFLKLGGDLVEVTPQVHPDNLQLFRTVARFFDVKLVGIDFICPDITIPWRDQHCAILELNSLPCIELHHFPSAGAPQNIAQPLVEALAKYH